MGPLVSVLISSYNGGEYLRPSVLSILDQTYRNLEIWVVDDGSTDGSLDRIADLADPRLRIRCQENAGKARTLNRLLDELSGEFYLVQDADDLSDPRRVERQMECLLGLPELAGCFTGHDLLIGDRQIAPRCRLKTPEECRRDIERFTMPAHDPTAMYRVSMVRSFRYEPSFLISEGHDYILRVGEKHPLMVLGECLYSYRIRPESLTHVDPRLRQRFVREVLRRACERRALDPEAKLRRLWRSDGPVPNWIADNNIVAHLIESTIDLRNVGRRSQALLTGLFSARLHPLDAYYYRPLFYALIPAFLLRLRGTRPVQATG